MRRTISLAWLLSSGLVAALLCGVGCGPDGGNPGDGDCEIGGTIDYPLTLSPSQCDPYRVVENIEVDGAGVLTIEPGTILEFQKDLGLFITGTGVLKAVGSADRAIVFTGASRIRGYWNGVIFNLASSFENTMSHVTIEYAGADLRSSGTDLGDYRAALEINDDSRLNMTWCRVQESAGFGVYILDDVYFGTDNVPDGDFANNTISANADFPVVVFSSRTGFVDSSNSLTGNDAGKDFVYVVGDYDYLSSQTWQNLEVPYLIRGCVSVDADEVLEIAPGTTLLFEQDAALEAYGTHSAIKAVGSAGEPIIFSAVEQIKGWWTGLHFNDTNSRDNVLRHVVIEYGGSEAGSPSLDGYGNIVVTSSGNASSQFLEVTDSTIRHSGHWGISVAPETTTVIERLTYEDNTDGDFVVRQ